MFNKVILVKKIYYMAACTESPTGKYSLRHYNNDHEGLKVSDLFTMSFVGFTVMCSTGVAVSSAVVVIT